MSNSPRKSSAKHQARRDARHELRFPRWLEESGLPEQLRGEAGPDAWPVFRRLVELETERNLIPGVCVIDVEWLARVNGLAVSELAGLLDRLQSAGVLEVRETSPPNMTFTIPVPLEVPESEAVIVERLYATGVDPTRLYRRYAQPLESEDRYRRVIELYQSLFGLRMGPRTAETLTEIAETCSFGDVLQTFSDAYATGGKSLGWIKKQLL